MDLSTYSHKLGAEQLERPLSRPLLIDAFSGAGLFSAGLVEAGFEPVLAIELSRDAAAAYARNVSDRVVTGSVLGMRALPKADILVAGPPCQGFSTLGRRDPSDARNELCLSILPLVALARPTIVVVENVPPFLASPQWTLLVRSLRGRGYSVTTWQLDAADFGTPQRRRRAFTVASKVGPIAPPRSNGRRRVAGDVLSMPGSPIAADDPLHRWPAAKGLAAERIALIPPMGDRRDLVSAAPHLCAPSWFRLGCQATDGWGRIDPGQPANTLRCSFQNPSKGRYLHPHEDRTISLREGARLQGVPDGWVFTGPPQVVARQIGNGVPVPLAKAVGESLLAALDGRLDLAA